MNPQDLAAARFRPVRQAQERIAKAEARLARSVARREELRGQIGPAEQHDRQALGAALVAGKPEPESEAAKLKTELEREERNADALIDAVRAARESVAHVVAENRDSWARKAMRTLAAERLRYDAAITELEDARQALSDSAALVAWIDSGASQEAASDPLGGRIGTDAQGRPPISFGRTVDALREDCEHLASHPVTHDDPAAEPRLELAWRNR